MIDRRLALVGSLTAFAGYALVREARAARPGDRRMAARRWIDRQEELARGLHDGSVGQVAWRDEVNRLAGEVDVAQLMAEVARSKVTEAGPPFMKDPVKRHVRFLDEDGQPRKLTYGAATFTFSPGNVITPHAHKHMASAHMVVEGKVRIRTFDRLREEDGALVIRPTGDQVARVGQAAAMTTAKDNVHWFTPRSAAGRDLRRHPVGPRRRPAELQDPAGRSPRGPAAGGRRHPRAAAELRGVDAALFRRYVGLHGRPHPVPGRQRPRHRRRPRAALPHPGQGAGGPGRRMRLRGAAAGAAPARQLRRAQGRRDRGQGRRGPRRPGRDRRQGRPRPRRGLRGDRPLPAGGRGRAAPAAGEGGGHRRPRRPQARRRPAGRPQPRPRPGGLRRPAARRAPSGWSARPSPWSGPSSARCASRRWRAGGGASRCAGPWSRWG